MLWKWENRKVGANVWGCIVNHKQKLLAMKSCEMSLQLYAMWLFEGLPIIVLHHPQVEMGVEVDPANSNTFISFPFFPTWLRRASLTFSIGCRVSCLVATTPGCSGFSRYENHSLWLVIWFDAPESTYHTSSNFGVVFFIEFASCLLTKPVTFPIFLDPSA